MNEGHKETKINNLTDDSSDFNCVQEALAINLKDNMEGILTVRESSLRALSASMPNLNGISVISRTCARNYRGSVNNQDCFPHRYAN